MNTDYSPLRITLTGQFAAALRLAARTDKRTMIAFLEVNLPLLAPYAQAWETLDALAVPVPPAPALAALASTGLVPPAQRASDTDKTGWTDAEIDTWNHTEICPLWRSGLALPV